MSDTKTVDASPTKQFFVRMLTRDIKLLDAILDLLDNCIDGIIRSNRAKDDKVDPAKPYRGYYAKITAEKTRFVIKDNCGGIPRDIAQRVAFRLGRPTDEELTKLGVKVAKEGTVGVYGIGMKRAIFKMGRQAVITSQHNNDTFKVEIEPEWLTSGSWELELQEAKAGKTPGTTIQVNQLYPEIAAQFSPETNFLATLYTAIAELFAVIIGKGFQVELNGKAVAPVTLALLLSKTGNGDTINPYVFKGRLEEVDVEVIVGFYREPYKNGEADVDDEDDPRQDVRQAGWSVVCNDRLVLYGDKSLMTGWGTKALPRFHNQYNAIAGVVTLKSEDPERLPFNTTKHGIEVNFGVYLKVLDYMKDGARRFVDFTNKWKGRLNDTAPKFKDAKPVPVSEIPAAIPDEAFSKVTGSRLADKEAEAKEYKPKLPTPPREPTTQRIQFSRPSLEVAEIGRELLGDETASPKDVGEACFDQVLRDIRKKKKKS